MKRILFAILTMAGVVALPASATAQHFYIEIGDDMPDREAHSQWQKLSGTYETLLKELSYYPKKVYQDGMPVATRIQAGPIQTKEEAQKICKKLFANDTPCFVIEDLAIAPPKVIVSLAEKIQEQGGGQVIAAPPAVLPWLAPRDDAAATHQENGLWSWLTGSDSRSDDAGYGGEAVATRTLEPLAPIEEHTPAAIKPLATTSDKENARKADVEVAEAIRVPLTENREMQPLATIQPATDLHLQKRRPAENPPVASPIMASSGWLNVSSFENETHASHTWQQVRRTIPERAAGLRVRIIRPFINEGGAGASLNIGPFASSSDAIAFCDDGIRPINNSLHCRFTSEEPSGVAEAIRPRVTQHADSYHERRMLLAAQRNARLASAAGTPATPPRISKAYWVEVVSAASQMEALNAWEDLRSAHSDLLGNRRSNISSSLNKPERYTIRVGPIADNSEALTLCTDLKNRQIDCNIVLSSR